MFKSVLLPIDLSSASSWTGALPAALQLCASEQGVIHVVTVVPDFGMSVVSGFFDKDFEQRALDTVGQQLAQWVSAHTPTSVEVHPHVLHGRVYEQIIEAANKLDVDVIVMGSHTPELSDFMLGPNAARVVRHARQSVFVVRASAENA